MDDIPDRVFGDVFLDIIEDMPDIVGELDCFFLDIIDDIPDRVDGLDCFFLDIIEDNPTAEVEAVDGRGVLDDMLDDALDDVLSDIPDVLLFNDGAVFDVLILMDVFGVVVTGCVLKDTLLGLVFVALRLDFRVDDLDIIPDNDVTLGADDVIGEVGGVLDTLGSDCSLGVSVFIGDAMIGSSSRSLSFLIGDTGELGILIEVCTGTGSSSTFMRLTTNLESSRTADLRYFVLSLMSCMLWYSSSV
tara:strand:- start:1948 stop:2685 length:738 start_codon:yes stop_codon:yes gene_type:complete